jgi:hypothetical protein
MSLMRPMLAASAIVAASWVTAAAELPPAKTPAELAGVIDAQMASTWQTERLLPSNPCLDHEYLRRVYLDIAGVIPSEQTVSQFLSNPRPEKRVIVVDQLLKSDASARYAAVVWGNLLMGRGTGAEALFQQRFRDWLYEQFKSNARFDRTVTSILTASGTAVQNPAVTWTLHHDAKPENLTGAAAEAFLGIQIRCAQCHDHPFDSWRQEDFYGIAAFFARTSAGPSLLGLQVREGATGEIHLGGTPAAKVIAPTLPPGSSLPPSAGPRREQLARWIIDPANKQFARAIVNRVWGQMLGRGLVDPVDDMRANNKSDFPEVLELLADGFIASGYDLHFLLRTITRTRAYQVSSRPSRNNRNDQRFFSKARLRRLGPEQLVASVVMSTGLGDQAKTWRNPLFQFLMQAVQKDFIFVFPNMDETTEVSEFRGTIAQTLLMMNSKHMAAATDFNLLSPLTGKLAKCRAVDEKIALLFRATLSRPPNPKELRNFARYFLGVTRLQDQHEICEDLYWALLNSNEFAFNY